MKLNNIFRIFLVVLAISAIIFVFPRRSSFRYEYQKGSPWKHENLIANYDFPIYKSEKEYQKEKKNLLLNFYPHFNINTEISKKQIENFETNFKESVQKILENDSVYFSKSSLKKEFTDSANIFKEEIKNTLEKIYSFGIIENSEIIEDEISDTFKIVVLKDKIAEEFNYSEIYTLKKAYSLLKNKFSSDIPNENFIGIPRIEFENYIRPNLFYNSEISEKVKQDMLSEISRVRGMVQKGELIIYKGELVDEQKFLVLNSFKKEYENSAGELTNIGTILLGQIIIVLLLFTVLFFNILFFARKILDNTLEVIFILLLPVIFIYLYAGLNYSDKFDIYIMPITIIPIIISGFYSARIGIAVHTITILIIGFFVPNGFEFVLIQFVAGYIATYGAVNLKTRGNLLQNAVLIFFSYSLMYTGFEIMQEGSFLQINLYKYLWFAGSSILILMSYPLTFVFEKLFGFVSDITLLELSDTNRPLLRMLAEKAPGTFQHSVQVANLAEEAVRKINGNTLLVRAGALYHDIGKTKNPIYFTENKLFGQSPHDKIEPEESAKIIIDHTINGVQIAGKNKLPEQITDFIRTHHGKSKVRWFLHAYKQKYPDKKVDETKFTYPGKLPYSKETAVLAMADSVEAASRSLKTINEKTVNDLVENIVNHQITEHYFDNADITFAQISKVKEVFKEKLKNIYHSRIEYPED